MRKRCYIVLVVIVGWLVGCLAGCGKATSRADADTTPAGRELIADARFERGMALSPLWPHIVQQGGGFSRTCTDTLRFAECDLKPIWQLCQWSSRYDLAGAEPKHEADGRDKAGEASKTSETGKTSEVAFENEAKRVALAEDGTLTLGLTTSREYDHPRKADEPWTPLLVQQDFDSPPHIAEIEALHFAMELKVDYCHNRLGEAFDEEIHTAQAPFYLMVRNGNKESKDYGLGLWVGIPTFDYRYKRLADTETIHWDVGTATYIYTIPPRKVWGDVDLGDGEWHKAARDILPLVLRAVEAMREKGCFMDSAPEDLAITGMNFGWEIPGTFDASLRMRGLSLRAEGIQNSNFFRL